MRLSTVEFGDSTSVWQDRTAKSCSYFCRKEPVRIDQELLVKLKALAGQQGSQNVRLCLHDRPQAAFHEMIILEHSGKFYRPHKHPRKGESYHIIEGAMGVFIFNERGDVGDTCVLNPQSSMVYRVGTNMYHAVMPLSEFVIYHESKLGPFIRESDCLYPAWAPDGTDQQVAMEYTQMLREALAMQHPFDRVLQLDQAHG